ncbi:MAG TPA: glycine cleavage system aminomethyltransferase GcvT [Nitrososphaeraceae archaeon]|nr:glycine cleavage system aminomethyltransferase GcvT [Nitrososphaeraceae archaeon]
MKTPLYDLHIKYGAKIVDFHGWKMPLQYSGIIEEHVNTRYNVSIFDVSHMGRFEVTGTEAFHVLQMLATNDISILDDNQALYSPICRNDGGIIDDLIIYRINSARYLVVVNASNRIKDFRWISSHSKSAAVITDISDDTVLLAVQGPLALNVIEQVFPKLNLARLKPFDLIITSISAQGETDHDHASEEGKEDMQNTKNELLISRTGYTGEDGFELLFDSSLTSIWEKLLQKGSPYNVKPAGLGARDTLRLEAGLMLYGNEMDETTTPFEVPLKWTVKLEKADFVGKQALSDRPISKKLVGFEVLERRIARHGSRVQINGKVAGRVTSGSYSPTLKKSIGMCFVSPSVSSAQEIEIDIGGKIYRSKITPSTRFYKRK